MPSKISPRQENVIFDLIKHSLFSSRHLASLHVHTVYNEGIQLGIIFSNINNKNIRLLKKSRIKNDRPCGRFL